MANIKTDWGEVVTMGSTEEYSCSLLRVHPGQKIPNHIHKKMREIEIIAKGEALVNGNVLKKDSISIWEPNQSHEYINNSDEILEVICLACPPYDPLDEIPVEKA